MTQVRAVGSGWRTTAAALAAVTLAATGCAELGFGAPRDEPGTRGTSYSDLCDGCGSYSSTTPEPPGAVRLFAVSPADDEADEVGRWDLDGASYGGGALTRIEDVDGDGVRDVVTSWIGASVLASADGRGWFARVVAAYGASAVGDIDGDGWTDLGVDEQDAVVPGALLVRGAVVSAEDGWPVTPKAAFGAPGPDVDRDGLGDSVWVKLDWPASDGTRIRFVLGADAVDGEVRLEDAVVDLVHSADAINAGRSVDAGDVNGDGVNDLALGESGGGGHLLVYDGASLAAGEVSLIASVSAQAASQQTSPSVFTVVALGDVDADGLDDLAIAWAPAGGDTVGRIVGGAELATAPLTSLGRPIPTFGADDVIDGTDLDGDGLSELAVTHRPARTADVFRGTALGAGGPAVGSWRFGPTYATAIAGLDGDTLYAWGGDPEAFPAGY